MIGVARSAAVSAAVADRGLDAVVIVNPTNVAYAGGFHATPFERLIALVLTREGELRLVVPSLEEEEAAHAVEGNGRLFVWEDADGPAGAVTDALEGLPAGAKIGIEHEFLTVARLGLLQSVRPEAQFVDFGPALVELRVTKDADELALIAAAAAAADRVVGEVAANAVRPGVTESEASVACAQAIEATGGRVEMRPLVLSGARAALPHGSPGATRFEEGGFVLCDFVFTVDGYWTDITRTFVIGEPSAQQQEMFEVVRDAQLAAVAATAPGVTAASIDRAARAVIEDAGFGEYFIHRTGHGLGLDVHEAPYLNAANEEPLRPGMVVTIEPGVYIAGVGGVRIEDVVVVTEDGHDVLTRYPITPAP
jgi:Xaa-Pro aminopeptidase